MRVLCCLVCLVCTSLGINGKQRTRTEEGTKRNRTTSNQQKAANNNEQRATNTNDRRNQQRATKQPTNQKRKTQRKRHITKKNLVTIQTCHSPTAQHGRTATGPNLVHECPLGCVGVRVISTCDEDRKSCRSLSFSRLKRSNLR